MLWRIDLAAGSHYSRPMTLPLIFIWTILISAVTIFGAWYARRYNRPDGLMGLYVALVVISNVVASKAIAFDLGFTTLFAPGAALIFSVTFLVTDMVNEKFGRRETQRMIMIAVVANIAQVFFSYMIMNATPAPFFNGQSAFETVFGFVPRIVTAGLLAFYVSEMADAYIFQWFRKLTRGRQLWMRNAFSSLPSMFLDSAIFIVFAFYGVLPVIPLIIGLTAVKWLVGIIDIPFMYLSRAIMGRTNVAEFGHDSSTVLGA